MRYSLMAVGCLLIACTGGTPREGVLSGEIEGRPFALAGGHSRATNAKGGRAIDLADYGIACGDAMAGAQPGSRFVSLLMAEDRGPGEYVVDSQPLGAKVSAVVTIWKQSDADGSLYAESLILNQGSIELRQADEATASGAAKLGAAATKLSGSFAVETCK
ncbi:MAG: hypothetical protein ACYC8T_00770 [Myxococcaceae bacterium]